MGAAYLDKHSYAWSKHEPTLTIFPGKSVYCNVTMFECKYCMILKHRITFQTQKPNSVAVRYQMLHDSSEERVTSALLMCASSFCIMLPDNLHTYTDKTRHCANVWQSYSMSSRRTELHLHDFTWKVKETSRSIFFSHISVPQSGTQSYIWRGLRKLWLWSFEMCHTSALAENVLMTCFSFGVTQLWFVALMIATSTSCSVFHAWTCNYYTHNVLCTAYSRSELGNVSISADVLINLTMKFILTFIGRRSQDPEVSLPACIKP